MEEFRSSTLRPTMLGRPPKVPATTPPSTPLARQAPLWSLLISALLRLVNLGFCPCPLGFRFLGGNLSFGVGLGLLRLAFPLQPLISEHGAGYVLRLALYVFAHAFSSSLGSSVWHSTPLSNRFDHSIVRQWPSP